MSLVTETLSLQIRLPGPEPEGVAWEERSYRIMLGEDCRMDIPEDMRLTSQYRASLAHKVEAVKNSTGRFALDENVKCQCQFMPIVAN